MPDVRIRLMKSFVGEEEKAALSSVIEHAYLAMGADVEAFEHDLGAYLGGQREVMAVNSGTAALHLALQACDIGPGDEVLVPTFTYIATFQAISASGATPVACDVRADNGCIDLADAAARITSRTRAIMPVHYAGGVGDLAAVYGLARRHDLRVIEDAAHAFGTRYNGVMIGARGDIVCFSFDGVKNITSGEGGAVVTVDRGVAERVRDARLLGVQKDTDKRYAGERSWDFDVTEQGWRYHMSNLFAAIGRVQLARFERELKPRRIAIAKRYAQALGGMAGMRIIGQDFGAVVPFSYPVFISGGNRDLVRAHLAEGGIETGVPFKPNHLLTKYGDGSVRLPVAERLYSEVLTLPLHPALSDAEQNTVIAAMRNAMAPVASVALNAPGASES